MNNHRILTVTLLAALLWTAAASAADADFCYTIPHASGAALADSKTVFKCPLAGNHTISDLAKAGWVPVQIDQVMAPTSGSSKTLSTLEQERLLIAKK